MKIIITGELFTFGQKSLLDHGLHVVHEAKKENWLKNYMQVEVGVKCMPIKFGGHGFSGYRDSTPFHLPSNLATFPFQVMDYNSP